MDKKKQLKKLLIESDIIQYIKDLYTELKKRLPNILSSLEPKKLSLDDSIKLYEEGIAISKNIERALKEAEAKVEAEEGNKKENEKEIKNLNNEQATPKPVASSNKYYIKINNAANVVTIYEKDENGEYNNPVKAMICSTGTATPASGKYPIKYRWTWLKLFGNVWGHYVTQINGNILFHSVPYLRFPFPVSKMLRKRDITTAQVVSKVMFVRYAIAHHHKKALSETKIYLPSYPFL